MAIIYFPIRCYPGIFAFNQKKSGNQMVPAQKEQGEEEDLVQRAVGGLRLMGESAQAA